MEDKKSTELPLPKPQKRVPWWISVLLAIGSYCTLKFVVPELPLTNITLQKLAQAAPSFAPLATIPFLLLAAKQLYDTDLGDEKHDKLDSNHEKERQE